MNVSNEIATIIMNVNATALDGFHKAPLEKQDDAQITEFAYISNKEVLQFTAAGLSTSGQSTKDFSKQSWAIDFGKYKVKGAPKDLLFGRSSLKLRAEETDATLA